MNFWGLSNLDTEWKNQSCARMKCKLSFYITPFVSRNENWHLPLFFSGMNWWDSVGKKIPLKGLRSLSSRSNLNGWCYSIVLIWICLTYSIVTHPLMTLTVTKERKLKVLLCNSHADLHVRGLDMMRSYILYVFQLLLFPKDGLRNLFESRLCEMCLTKVARRQILKTMNITQSTSFIMYPPLHRGRNIKWHFAK